MNLDIACILSNFYLKYKFIMLLFEDILYDIDNFSFSIVQVCYNIKVNNFRMHPFVQKRS